MNKKIILACSIFNFGGVGKMMNFVASNLLTQGWEIIILSLRHEKRPDFLPTSAQFISLKKERFKYCLLWRLEEIVNLRLLLRELKPFTICTFGSEPSVMVRLATMGMRRITVVSAERSDPYTSEKVWQKLSAWAYRHSDYCVFQLEKQRDFFDETVKRKSFVIPNAFIPAKIVKKCEDKRYVVVSAGRFVYQKGYDTLIRAFAKVNEKHPEYSLELYGGGDDRILYEEIIKDLNLTGKVLLFDYVKNVSSIIAGCGVFVLSSRFEGIPNVLIEAMSVGVPTVSTNCTPGGPFFLTDNGRRGLLVNVDDTEAMVSAINSIIESPELSEKLSVAGKEICDILDEKVIAKQWVDMFAQITTQI